MLELFAFVNGRYWEWQSEPSTSSEPWPLRWGVTGWGVGRLSLWSSGSTRILMVPMIGSKWPYFWLAQLWGPEHQEETSSPSWRKGKRRRHGIRMLGLESQHCQFQLFHIGTGIFAKSKWIVNPDDWGACRCLVLFYYEVVKGLRSRIHSGQGPLCKPFILLWTDHFGGSKDFFFSRLVRRKLLDFGIETPHSK